LATPKQPVKLPHFAPRNRGFDVESTANQIAKSRSIGLQKILLNGEKVLDNPERPV
jgi:hypothetical protein